MNAAMGTSITDQVRTVLEQTFRLPSGRLVRWEEATIEDHQERIDAQLKHLEHIADEAKRAVVCDGTIAQHQKAIDALREQARAH